MKYYKNNQEYTASQVRKAVSPSTLPKEFTPKQVLSKGFYPIIETPKPEITKFQKIEAGGLSMIENEYHRTWNVVNKFSTQEEIDAFLLQEFETKKAEVQSKINALFTAEIAALKGDIQQGEIDTFDSQKQEAIAYQIDPSADTPLLSGLATVRGLTVADLAVRVLGHVAAYKAAMGQIMGKKHALEDQLGLAITIDDLERIDV